MYVANIQQMVNVQLMQNMPMNFLGSHLRKFKCVF